MEEEEEVLSIYSSCEFESWVSSESIENHDHKITEEEEEESERLRRSKSESLGMGKKKKKKKNGVLLEGYVDEDVERSKSLRDEDLDELKGCLDLGFGFNYDEIPQLCNTLPALELCYSISHKFIHNSPDPSPSPHSLSTSIANWRISSPGDHPEDVKARLKFWAQAVACTVKLCS